jgi:hypothetical protein
MTRKVCSMTSDKKHSRRANPLTPKGIAKPRPTHYQAKLAAHIAASHHLVDDADKRSAGFIRTAQSLSRRSPQRQA